MEAARTAAVRERELQIRAILSSRSDLVKELFEREIAPLSPVTSSDQRRMFNEFADGFRIRAPNQPSDPAPLSNAGPLATAQVLPIQNGVDSTADRVDSMAAPPLPTEQTRKRARLMPSTPKRASKATLKMDLTQTTALRYRALPSKPQRREERYQLIEWHLKVQNPKLSELLSAGNKVVMTKDWQLAREEAKQVKMIKRIEEMKANNVWSFRQLKRQPEPRIAPSRHDFMMEEMRLMREDFRQERKWKMAQAYTLAGWVLEWHNAENKASLCVTRLRKALPATRNETEALSDEKAKLEDSEWSLDHIIRDEALQPANDGSQLETAEVPHEEAMKREVEVLSARTAIDLDVDFQSSVYFYEDSDSGLFGSASSIYGVYGLPSVSEAEAERPTEYFDQVVPVSKFMANRWFSPGAFGNSKADYEGPVENEGVRTDVISRKQSIFGGDGESNVMDDEIPPPQSATPVQDSISRSPWSIDEDDALLMLGTESSHNWGLISESLSAMHLGPGEKRGEWECYNRYKTLVALRGDKGSEISKSSKFRTRTVTKQDMGRRMARMLSTFEFIQRKARQRPERLNRSKLKFFNLLS
ncbi:hypothetical protein DFJ73DRAFT_372658 [Zopfochytrium polystomum]|nr:hypothetical protein DFJ73DRAFT_372658 [Zopfochytrium polystomum]